MVDANQRLAMRLTGYCLMPNHFHLLLWPYADGDLSRWMQWLLTGTSALPSPLSRQRARVARAFQGLSDRTGRALPDGLAVRGTECAAVGLGVPSRRLALVESVRLVRGLPGGVASSRTGRQGAAMAATSEPRRNGGRVTASAAMRQPRNASWLRRVGRVHRLSAGPGVLASTSRPASQKSRMSPFFLPCWPWPSAWHFPRWSSLRRRRRPRRAARGAAGPRRLSGGSSCAASAGLPIGVFDSGTGGLAVLEEILRLDRFDNDTGTPISSGDGRPDFADEQFVFLADQANMPYGNYPAAGKRSLLVELVLKDSLFLLGTAYAEGPR